jgi:hypothetical protein
MAPNFLVEFLVRLGFELRALCLQSRCSSAWATLPVSYWIFGSFLSIFQSPFYFVDSVIIIHMIQFTLGASLNFILINQMYLGFNLFPLFSTHSTYFKNFCCVFLPSSFSPFTSQQWSRHLILMSSSRSWIDVLLLTTTGS